MAERSPISPHRGSVNPYTISEVIGPNCIVQSKEEVSEKMRRKGMCTKCGLVRTHSGFHFRRKPITAPGEVYKGYCLKCNDMDEVKRMLGEEPGKNGEASDSNMKQERRSTVGSLLAHANRKSFSRRSTEEALDPFEISVISGIAPSDASDVSSLGFPSVSSVECESAQSLQSGPSGSLTRKHHEQTTTPIINRSEESARSAEAKDSFRSNDNQGEIPNPNCDVRFKKSMTLPDILEDKLNVEVGKKRRAASLEHCHIHEEDSRNTAPTDSSPTSSQSSMVHAQHEENPPESTSASSSRSTTSSSAEALSTIIGKFESGDFLGALGIMRRESGSTPLILAGLEKLRIAVPLEASKSKSIDSSQILPPSWIKIIVTCIMSRHCNNVTIQSEAIQTIWAISSMSLKYKTDVTTQTGVDAIVDAMVRFPKDLGVQMHGAGALSCLCASERHAVQVRLVRKATACIIGALKYESNDGSVEEFAIRALHGLFLTSGGMTQLLRERAHVENLPGKILSVMLRHTSNATVQLWACRLLWILLEGLTDQSQDCDERDSEISIFDILGDVIVLITDIMSIHKDDEMLHEVSCGFLLCCFSLGDFVESLLSTKIKPISESIVQSMECHPNSSTLQIYGCRVIHSICSMCEDSKSTCEMMVQLGSIDVILRSMQDHVNDSCLQAEACGAITVLCEGAPWLKDTISDSGGIITIANAYQLHKHSVSMDDSCNLMEQACMTMATLATSSKCVAAIQSMDILDDFMDEIDVTCSAESCESGRPFTALSNVILNVLADGHKNGSCNENQAHSVAAVSLALRILTIRTSEEDLVGAINFLYVISDNIDCVTTILSSGGRDELMSVMQSYLDSAEIQEMSCRLLSRIYTKVHEDTSIIRSINEIKHISAAMKNHRGELSVQEAACLALRNYCTAPWNPSESIIAELFEAVNDVAQASKIHGKSAVVQESACGAFWAISTTGDAMAVSIASSGGMWCIVEAMASFPTVMSLQNDACAALLNLTVQQENLMVIGSEQCIEVIIRCLCHFGSDLEIAEKVCSIVAVISSGLPQASFVLIDHATAVNQLIECMSRFPQSETIQVSCSETISNISVDDRTRNNIVGLGGIDRLSTAMKDHPDTPLVLEKACKAMEKITRGVQYDGLVRNSVGQQIIDSMNRYENNVNIQVSGISVLFSLSLNDRNNKAVIAGLGGINAIISSMRNHPRSALLQEKACKMLWSLCVLETNQVAIGQCGGIQTIIDCMKEHLTAVGVQMGALGALKALAVLIPNKDAIINCGGIDTIVEVMLVHGGNEKIIKSCFGALSNIAVNPYVMTKAELDAVVGSMQTFSLSEDVQLYGCRLLRNYTFAPSNVKLMKGSELLPVLIQSAAISFPHSCGERAQYLLNIL